MSALSIIESLRGVAAVSKQVADLQSNLSRLSRLTLLLDVLGLPALTLVLLSVRDSVQYISSALTVEMPPVAEFLLSIPSFAIVLVIVGLLTALIFHEKHNAAKGQTLFANLCVCIASLAIVVAYLAVIVLGFVDQTR